MAPTKKGSKNEKETPGKKNSPTKKSPFKRFNGDIQSVTMNPKNVIHKAFGVVPTPTATPKFMLAYYGRPLYENDKTWVDYLTSQAAVNKAEWCQRLGLANMEFFLHKDGQMVKPNKSKFGQRMFFYAGEHDFESDQEAIDHVRNNLCPIYLHNMNPKVKPDQQLSIPSEDEVLLEFHRDAVFSDFAGQDAAGEMLLRILGIAYNKETDFEHHSDIIFSFFHRGNIPKRFGDLIGAPDHEIRADFHEP